ncbi:thermonuclease family protein [Bartonella sp. TP]|uniref:thermonuclease family protein n=1 Tax=Bartonella sp. TP TaxID=3057550 RepID=UPI0025AF4142|nr:thermonuclease family protein [Bartonella sp. TP]MDN5248920.1 thermonuclease family protein [Alphaproteobacteria bacterium]MDN5249031.1 thermonuclease family protein [Alphaproteobacteria bacterium]WJW80072.1 thermonuclease family protein [Bartonella sp. TP]
MPAAKDIIVISLLLGIILYLYLAKNENYKQPAHDTAEITVQGKPYLIDGDSIKVAGLEMRLMGMDAPEFLQKCGSPGQEYFCGQEARKHLAQLINKRNIVCHYKKLDIYHRALALCFAGEILLNRQMVRDGWAVSFYDYKLEEKQARGEKLGIWSGPFELPKYWRRQHKHKDRPLANAQLL